MSDADKIEKLREALECVIDYFSVVESADDYWIALSLEEVVNIARETLKETTNV